MWTIERNGSKYLVERVYDPLTGRDRKVSVKITKDTPTGRKEAQKRLLDKLDEQAPKKMRVSDLIELYKKEMEKTIKYSTYRRNCCALDGMMKIIDDVYLDKLTAGYVRMKLLESGKKSITMNEMLKRFKSMLMWGYRNDYLPDRSIPDKLMLFPDKTKHERIQDKYLEKDELQKLVDGISLERWKLLTQFLALSGLRIGEAAGLNNEDVTAEYIIVNKSYSGNFHQLWEPKTASSVREVFIQPELAEVIKKIRVCMMRQRMMFGYEDKGYFISGPDGERFGHAAYAKYLKETVQKVGIEKNVTPHILRHTMTSLFAESGASLEAISRRLGHDSSDITRDVYLHITKTRKTMDNAEIQNIKIFG